MGGAGNDVILTKAYRNSRLQVAGGGGKSGRVPSQIAVHREKGVKRLILVNLKAKAENKLGKAGSLEMAKVDQQGDDRATGKAMGTRGEMPTYGRQDKTGED